MGRPPVTSRLARREFDEQVRRAAAVEAEQLRRRIEQMQRELRRLEQWIGRDVR